MIHAWLARLKTCLLFCLALVLVFALSGSPKPGGEATERAAPAQADPPNILFILTDDMRKDDLRYMPKTKSLIQNRGTTFDNAFVTYSLCCPARATFLRGQYARNHDVRTNAASARRSGLGSSAGTARRWRRGSTTLDTKLVSSGSI